MAARENAVAGGGRRRGGLRTLPAAWRGGREYRPAKSDRPPVAVALWATRVSTSLAGASHSEAATEIDWPSLDRPCDKSLAGSPTRSVSPFPCRLAFSD